MEPGAPFTLPRLINTDQLAAIIGITRKALYHAIDAGQVPTPLKIGNRLRWRPDDITAWIQEKAQAEADFRNGQ